MTHNNTIFHSMLKLIPRHQFEALENQHNTGRKSRTFSRWESIRASYVYATYRQSKPA